MLLNILLPPMIIFVGGFFIAKLRFFYIIHPIKTLRYALGGKNTGGALSSLMLALAGTLGVGNIVGVTIGLAIGGAGSVFWLMVSALFSSAIKYAEVALSCESGKRVGMIGVIESAFVTRGRTLSRCYAVLCLILSLSMGCLLQASAIRGIAESSNKIDTGALIIPFTAIAAIICIRGRERVKKAVAVIIPLATICYTVMCLFVIIPNFSRLPEVIMNILSSALSPRSLAGGIGAYLTKSGMKEGFAKGLLSNEAGAGTSSFSHTSLPDDGAYRAGCFGIIEVFFDTLILCPLTAFTILLATEGAVSPNIDTLSGLFSFYVGANSDILFLFSVSAFAVSTVLCWYYYGEVCRENLFGSSFKKLYFIIFILMFALGLAKDSESAVFVTDTILFLLSLLTLSALIKKSDGVCPPPEKEFNKSFKKRRNSSDE